ncbi:MAG TPA: D-aminoacyl-tRNA deacylase [Kiritimatiellia bacterium]|jgi:D-tyrosyl-tRNA(Tyr) deacylase|nr:D-tyrosyl-tRNA(Tyr) deacylase [Kiritimatiellia bacterium]OQC57602.1 MAG: D-tyrosyl-tRNA(Tyr) deacylase [Verrucomicrobia bacterium ADurb.Bin018]MBP9572375.1 D-tyrosyl-tRNA(Tyr) deacylase [Kiritimatiellia bacterium]HOE01076.1 D-aminoacyl-tRNA deacylase [Kiritimatiellia bacterium]HOE36353.1 D-aminoacyl-tRNA deacylase [Kiritimatiellia bacterium]
MRAVVQRVARAEVRSEGRVTGRIGPGAVVLLGVGRTDTAAEAAKLADKVAKLRIFDDADGKMNLSIAAVPDGKFIVVSQFTLLGNTERGNRPSYIEAAPPEQAEALYELFVAHLRGLGFGVETGVFRTMMQVELVNDGPVTLLLDTADWA